MPRFDPDQYVDVQERIVRFWIDHPNGAIRTVMETAGSQFDAVVFKAGVYKDRNSDTPDATGYAAEERGADVRAGANFTSWHENAETSAIGRALANLGYATSRDNRPTKQEIQKVNRAQDAPQTHQKPPEPPKSTRSGNVIPKTAPMLSDAEAVAGFYSDIEHAPDSDALYQTGALIAASGIDDEGLRDAYRKRMAAFTSTS
jgi:hypothetical protein